LRGERSTRIGRLKTKGDVRRTSPWIRNYLFLVGAARPVTAATAAAGAEIDAGVDSEAIAHEIDADGFGFLVKILIDDELETVHVEYIIGVARLVQSHGQGRPPSSAFVQKDANGLNFLVFKVFRDLVMSRRGNFYHDVPPRRCGLIRKAVHFKNDSV
jgi:hypothetical protein